VLTTRYEDLLQNYDSEALRIAQFLGVNAADAPVKTVIEKYRPGGDVQGQQGTHYFKGQIGRFRERYTVEEQEILLAKFGDVLKKMGYAL